RLPECDGAFECRRTAGGRGELPGFDNRHAGGDQRFEGRGEPGYRQAAPRTASEGYVIDNRFHPAPPGFSARTAQRLDERENEGVKRQEPGENFEFISNDIATQYEIGCWSDQDGEMKQKGRIREAR